MEFKAIWEEKIKTQIFSFFMLTFEITEDKKEQLKKQRHDYPDINL